MKLRPTTTLKNSLRGKLPNTCLARMFIIKITLHMLNSYQSNASWICSVCIWLYPSLFYQSLSTQTLQFCPFPMLKAQIWLSFSNQPPTFQFSWYIALNICMLVLFLCKSVASLTQWRKNVMGPVLRQSGCQYYSQLLRNLKLKGIYSNCIPLKKIRIMNIWPQFLPCIFARQLL